MFAYHLQVRDLHLYVGKNQEGKKAPNVYASPMAKSIWRLGAAGAAELYAGLIRELGGELKALKPSRVDLCADFLMPKGVPLSMLRDLGMPADIMTCDIMQGAHLETYYIGANSAPIRARIYDKGKEVL
jgi:hypothetical protein